MLNFLGEEFIDPMKMWVKTFQFHGNIFTLEKIITIGLGLFHIEQIQAFLSYVNQSFLPDANRQGLILL